MIHDRSSFARENALFAEPRTGTGRAPEATSTEGAEIMNSDAEKERLQAAKNDVAPWKKWGLYLETGKQAAFVKGA